MGDGDGVAGGDAIEAFFRLHGDSDDDGDSADPFTFLGTRSRREGEPDLLPYLDFDTNGRIDHHDLQQLLGNARNAR